MLIEIKNWSREKNFIMVTERNLLIQRKIDEPFKKEIDEPKKKIQELQLPRKWWNQLY